MKKSICICAALLFAFALTTSGCKKQEGSSLVSDEYIAETDITSVDLDVKNSVVTVRTGDVEKVTVEYVAKNEFTIGETNGELSVKDTAAVTDSLNSDGLELTVTLPYGGMYDVSVEVVNGSVSLSADGVEYGEISLETSAGSITVDGDVFCVDFECEINTGSIEIGGSIYSSDKATLETSTGSITATYIAAETVSLKTGVGDIEVKLIDGATDYDTKVTKPSVGECNISNRTGGSRKLEVSCSLGNIDIMFETA